MVKDCMPVKELGCNETKISNTNLQFLSTGTAAVRGLQPLAINMHHYWEIRMESALYGTDVSVGVGTENACYNSHESSFVKLLGRDKFSWG